MTSHCTISEMATAAPYTRVHPNLFMGSKRAIQDTDPGDFDVYVSMATEITPPRSLRGEFESYHIKLNDAPWDFASHPQELLELIAVARDLAIMVRDGHKVLVVCNMGMNRSGLMSALILMHLGYSWRKALKTVRRRHGCTMSNESFVQALPYAQRIISES